MAEKIEFKDIVLIGRTFEEYKKMFHLSELTKDEKILDVASGVSSFCSEANLKGYNVTASDKIYNSSPSLIDKKCREDLEIVLDQLADVADHYQWEFFKDINGYGDMRRMAFGRFIADFKEKGQNRYIPVEFPKTQFKDNQFTISLVSHFLFLYDEHLDYEFHKKTILELIRITSKEIRIYPLINLRWKKSSLVQKLMIDSEFSNYKMSIQEVDYEFVRNGNEMLKIEIKKNNCYKKLDVP